MIRHPVPSLDALETQSQQSFAALLVSLYLVLLVFFIMLNAQAQVNASRQYDAISSLHSTFSSSKDRPSGPAASIPEGQDAQLIEEFYVELSALLSPLAELDGTHLAPQADHLVLTAPITAFFAPLQAEPRTEHLDTWQKLVLFAETYKNRLPFQLSLVVGTTSEPAGLPRDRAGAWARTLQNLGMAPQQMMAGQDPSLDGKVELRVTLQEGHHFMSLKP